MFCSRNGSPTPLNNIVFLLEVRIKSVREEEFSVKCVGSLIICSKLNCWHKSLTFHLELSFRISRLKSPVIKILDSWFRKQVLLNFLLMIRLHLLNWGVCRTYL